jgi:hypothetical protein
MATIPAKADFLGSVTGDPGPQGPAGPQGAQGAQGPQGPAGPSTVNKLVRVTATGTIAANDVGHVTATCPAGQAYVSGGFTAIGAENEVFYADTLGATNSYSVGVDNFDAAITADVEAAIYCAPSGQAVAPSALATRGSDVTASAESKADTKDAARRALHAR